MTAPPGSNSDPYPCDTITTYPLAPSSQGGDWVTRAAGPPTLQQAQLREQFEQRHGEAIKRAGIAYANALALCEQLTPREQAEAAWTPTSPYTVEQLEDKIREERGMAPRSQARY
jgi:hypothetical protein